MIINSGPILVVEDVPNLLQLLEVTLRFKGYPVVGVRNGREALEYIEKEKPALVITDILMPEVDGYSWHIHCAMTPLPARSRSFLFQRHTSLLMINLLPSSWERCVSLKNRSTRKISC